MVMMINIRKDLGNREKLLELLHCCALINVTMKSNLDFNRLVGVLTLLDLIAIMSNLVFNELVALLKLVDPINMSNLHFSFVVSE